jgi:glucose-1-phosphate adenylyltransferase
MKDVLALVLAGGRVPELLCLTENRAKSALPIFGIYRIIDFALSNLMNSGLYNVGILSQYRPHALVSHIGTGEHWDFTGREREVRILPPYRRSKASNWYKGTADAVHQNIDFIEEFNPKNVLIVSGDHIYSMNYEDLYNFHVSANADATICFTKSKAKTKRFGYGIIDKNEHLIKYSEKPDKPISDWISMTVYLFKTRFLIDVLKTNVLEKSHEFGKDIISKLTDKNRIYGFKHKNYWAYARTLDSYYQTNMDLLARKIDLSKWQIRTNISESCKDRDRAPAFINGDVKNSVISDGCVIEGVIRNSILSPGVRVAPGAHVIDSMIFHNTQIGKNAKLEKTICDMNTKIGEYSIIGGIENKIASKTLNTLLKSGITVLGENLHIPKSTKIGVNTVIYSSAKLNNLKIQPGTILT